MSSVSGSRMSQVPSSGSVQGTGVVQDTGAKGKTGSSQVEAPPFVDFEALSSERNKGVGTPPKIALMDIAHHDLLPTQAKFMDQCGRPKESRLFGLVKMSDAYKAVLGQMEHVDIALAKQGAPSISDIDTTISQLQDLRQLADAYIDGSSKHRFTPQMRELKSQAQETMDMLVQLKSEMQQAGSWPKNLTLKEAILYARQGISLEMASFFKLHHVDAEPAQEMLILENQTVSTLKTRIVELDVALPKGLSFVDAVAYQSEGIKPERAFFFRENGIPPQVAAKAIAGGYDGDLVRMGRESVDFLCEKSAFRREYIRSTGPRQLNPEPSSAFDDTHQNLGELIAHSERATDLYLQLFLRNNALPPEILWQPDGKIRSEGALKNMIEQFPVKSLPSADRETAFKLLNLIHENQTLAYTHFTSDGTSFRMPGDSVEAFGHGSDANLVKAKTLFENAKLAKTMVENALQRLIDPQIQGKTAPDLGALKTQLAGLLRDRPDIKMAFGVLPPVEREAVISGWIDSLGTLSPVQELALKSGPALKALTDLVATQMPVLGVNLQQGALLGAGGFGAVHDGTFMGNPVVIKRLNMGGEGKLYGEMLIEGLRQADFCNNPNIPKIIGVDTQSALGVNQALIVMEKVDGGQFRDIYTAHMPFPGGQTSADPQYCQMAELRAKVGVMAIGGAMKGLEAMHRMGFYHSDIKPDNIMYDTKTGQPRLIDFGTCARSGHFVLTTPDYCAPEMGNEGSGPCSDIYQLGVTLYGMATGESFMNFTGFSRPKTNVELFADNTLWNSSPVMRECKDLIEACTELDPDKRPTSVQILQAIRGEPISVGGETKGNPGLPPTKLHMLDALRPDRTYVTDARQALSALL